MLKFRVLQGLVEGDLVADNEYALGRLSLAADTSPLVADGVRGGGGDEASHYSAHPHQHLKFALIKKKQSSTK